ncbi:hypothetical protein ASC93_14020, partial [Massilia sp. Root335]
MLSTLVGGMLYAITTRSIESDVQERFVRHAKYAQAVINMRIKSYTDLLRGAASVLQSGDTNSHRQFHDYVQGLRLATNYPAVDTLNFAAWVLEEDRPQFEAEFTRELQAFLGPGARPVITPAGIRPAYLIVSYIEPDANNTRLYGLDLMGNPYFHTQLVQSRDDGQLRASGRPIAALSTPGDNHLGMRMPVYRHGSMLVNAEQRRAAYLGSLGIAFSLPKLLHGVMDEMPIPGVRMTLFDVGPRDVIGHDTATWPKVLFDSRGSASNPTPPLAGGNDVFTATLPLDFNGRPWQTTYSVPKARLRTNFDVYYPKLMMAFGFLGSILLYALLHILTSSRRAALGLAQEMTSELRESQARLQMSHQKLRRLADHAYQIKEMERKRIAREIHDDLGQSLLALRIEAELLAGRTKGTHSHLHKRARATLIQIDTTIKSVRQIINDLRPTVLD